MEKEKKQEETQAGLLYSSFILILILTQKYQGIRNSIIVPSVSPLVSLCARLLDSHVAPPPSPPPPPQLLPSSCAPVSR